MKREGHVPPKMSKRIKSSSYKGLSRHRDEDKYKEKLSIALIEQRRRLVKRHAS